MERMRTLLQKELWASLRSLPEDDMFALAWQLACGSTMARRGEVVRYEKGVVHVIVADAGWERQMRSMSGALQRELAVITRKPVTGIHFEVRKMALD